MKRLLSLLAVLALATSARADVETYQIDPVHSATGFSVRHLFSKFTSSFTKTTGTITVDQANMEHNTVEATIENLRDAWDVELGALPAEQARKVVIPFLASAST